MMRNHLAIGLATVLAAASLLTGCKVIDTGTESQYTGNTEFNADDSAAAIWDQAVQEVTDNAVDLGELLTEGDSDLKNADLVAKYNGHDLSTTENAAANVVVYAVTGTGTVTEVDSKSVSDDGSQMGTITVQLDNYSGSDTVLVSVGPSLKKTDTSFRDYLDFVALGQGEYGDTVKWAQLSASLNENVVSRVVSQVDLTTINGKKVTFTGTFATDATHPDRVTVTPVALSAQ